MKRVIGIPGDTIRISNGKVSIKTSHSSQFIEIQEPYLSVENQNETNLPFNIITTDFTVPAGQYWVMGDNRKNSSDSRNCFYFCENDSSNHFISRENITGRVLMDLGSFEFFQEKNFPKIGNIGWKHEPRFFNIPNSATYPELQ